MAISNTTGLTRFKTSGQQPNPANHIVDMINRLLIFLVAGEVIVLIFNAPLPANVVGLALMLGYLIWRREVPASLAHTVPHLMKHLSLLFVPVGVGVMTHWERLSAELLGLIAAIVGGAVTTLIVTGLTFCLALRLTGNSQPHPALPTPILPTPTLPTPTLPTED